MFPLLFVLISFLAGDASAMLQAKVDELTRELEHTGKLQETWKLSIEEALLEEGEPPGIEVATDEEIPLVERHAATTRRLEALGVLRKE